jgi:hypothetical protein
MDFSKSDKIIDVAQLDPRPEAKRAAREIAQQRLRDVPPEIADMILGSRLDPLASPGARSRQPRGRPSARVVVRGSAPRRPQPRP